MEEVLHRTSELVESFYRAALLGLRFLDDLQSSRTRFGAGADARWRSFAGHLHSDDRIDLLCRDVAISWGSVFAAAQVFGFDGLAPDEAFGGEWEGVQDRV